MSRNKRKIIRTVTVPQSIVFFEEVMMKMKSLGYETVVVTSPGVELESFKHRYPLERVVELPMERHIAFVKDLISLFRMIKVMYIERPYIVHSMTPKAGLITILAAWITRVPIRIHTFTGLVWPTASGLKRKILMVMDWLICTCATHIIPEGHGVLNDLKNNGICTKPMEVLGYGNVKGVDMTHFNPEKFSYIKKTNKEFRFLFVGRIVRDKGVNELIKAFSCLSKEYPTARLTLVGHYEPDLDPISSDSLKEINESSYISVCGHKFGDNLLEEFVKSDCFVQPSYREGFPNTVLEAGAMGLPCIVTDVNGSREIITNGKNGLIVPPRDYKALYGAMKQIMHDVEAREYMAKNARPVIESRFEKGFVQKCLIDYYETIL